MSGRPFVRDDGGQADAGIVSTLSEVQLSVVRAVAIVTRKPFAEVHEHGMLFRTADHESFASVLTSAYGLEEAEAAEDGSMKRARRLSRKRRARLVLRVIVPHYHYCAVVRGELRDTAPLPSEHPDYCEIDAAWASEADANRMDDIAADDPDTDASLL